MNRWLAVGLASLLVGVLAGGAIGVLSAQGGGQEVVLEPIDSTQENDFAGNLDTNSAAARSTRGATLGEIDDPRAERVRTALSGQVVEGTDPAVYGGSRDTRVCDVGGLVRFLRSPANTARAAAWAGVLGIEVEQIPSYVRQLTAVRLTFDTRVTNHGYSDREATEFQSALQSGTAVLVDNTGAPRVKCNCGNPLLEPSDLAEVGPDEALELDDLAQNPEAAWDGLDPAQVVSIRPAAQEVDEITLNDRENDGLLERPVGSDGESERDTGTGDVRVKLEWASDADLDLHVIEPGGTEISFQDKGPTATGGRLDVDSNISCENNGSIENVFWPSGDAPSGPYTVEVVGFTLTTSDGTDCGGGDFTLTIDVAGQQPQVQTGSVGEDESASFEFDVAPGLASQGVGESESEGDEPTAPAGDVATAGQACPSPDSPDVIQVRVVEGEASCSGALALFEAYRARAPSEGSGSAGFLSLDGWECSSTSPGDQERQRADGETVELARCVQDGSDDTFVVDDL